MLHSQTRIASILVALSLGISACGLSGDNAASDDTTRRAVDLEIPQIPGDAREDTVSALDDREHPSFPPPLVDPDEIRSGGPPPDGIPPIDVPRFEVASDVEWLDDVEPVVVVEVGEETRAYPIQILTWHEIVNDTFGDVPVTVSYCPLCNSAVAYIREADGRTFDFGTSGKLLNSSLVMYDRQTESLWSHYTAEAVIGALAGTKLETLPISTVAWSTFRDTNPDARVLSNLTGHARSYGQNPYPGYDNVNQQPFLFSGEVDGRLAAQTRVVALRGKDESLAIPLDDLASAGVISTTLDNEPIVVLHTDGMASALDSRSIADGRDVGQVGVYRAPDDLELATTGNGTFADATSGAVFNILGKVEGSEGRDLETVEHLDTFWFAIAAFEPDTRIVSS